MVSLQRSVTPHFPNPVLIEVGQYEQRVDEEWKLRQLRNMYHFPHRHHSPGQVPIYAPLCGLRCRTLAGLRIVLSGVEFE